jgi:hypothetical protein
LYHGEVALCIFQVFCPFFADSIVHWSVDPISTRNYSSCSISSSEHTLSKSSRNCPISQLSEHFKMLTRVVRQTARNAQLVPRRAFAASVAVRRCNACVICRTTRSSCRSCLMASGHWNPLSAAKSWRQAVCRLFIDGSYITSDITRPT